MDFDFLGSVDGRHARSSVQKIDASTAHCLHPDFIRYKVRSSAARLGVDRIDYVLVHNPEYQVGPRLGDVLEDAFGALEECVSAGLIEYYGVSSNRLPFQREIGLENLVEAARRAGSGSTFRMIQFPFNLAEWDAGVCQSADSSLIDKAKEKRIVTVSNRPLNAKYSNRLMRFIGNYEQSRECDIEDIFRELAIEIDGCMGERNIEGRFAAIPSVVSLSKALYEGVDPELGVRSFLITAGGILDAIFDGETPRRIDVLVEKIAREVPRYCAHRLSENAKLFLSQMQIEERARACIGSGCMQVSACDALFNAGVDHVLVGMRNPKYVHEFRAFFSPKSI